MCEEWTCFLPPRWLWTVTMWKKIPNRSCRAATVHKQSMVINVDKSAVVVTFSSHTLYIPTCDKHKHTLSVRFASHHLWTLKYFSKSFTEDVAWTKCWMPRWWYLMSQCHRLVWDGAAFEQIWEPELKISLFLSVFLQSCRAPSPAANSNTAKHSHTLRWKLPSKVGCQEAGNCRTSLLDIFGDGGFYVFF